VARSGRQSLVTVSGNANKNKLGMRRKVETIADELLETEGHTGHNRSENHEG
jgi:hypothetical protein